MKPIYFVGKIIAAASALYAFWQLNFDFSSSAGKADVGLAVSAIGSLFESNKTLNEAIGFITKFLGIPYTPDPPATV
jgi:hypothetical protein